MTDASRTEASGPSNPVVYFEIPVTDMDRAIRFYEGVFAFQFQRETIDGNEMALFPLSGNAQGITGALAKGEAYVPTRNGPILYFHTGDIDESLKRAHANGGKTLYPKTAIGANGFVAEFEDSEGNRIALNSRP
ncbi:MAG: VOC family protein [Bryobacteraceae bacterium]|nr:VOC family protein [Bryobacteraceae bacterium]